MSSNSIRKTNNELGESKVNDKLPINFHRAVVTFSQFVGVSITKFIYTGEEKMPFHKRHPKYQIIFQSEFADEIKNLEK